MHLRIPVWLFCFVYLVCVSCKECRKEKGLVNCEFQHTDEDTVCNITVSHRSASYLMTMFNKIDPDVAHFKLEFPQSLVVNAMEEAIQPFRWMWTFQSEDMKVPFLQFDFDYATLSFGLLNSKALPEILVNFDVEPPNCSITIGKRKSNLEIAYAFSNVTNRYFNYVDFKYDDEYVDNRNHSWCYLAERPLFKGSYQYNCCYSYYDFANEEMNVNCSEDWLHDGSESYSSLETKLFILGFIILCYFPIPLLNVVSNMSGKTHRNGCKSSDDDFDNLASDIVSNTSVKTPSNGYKSLDDNCDDLASDIVYLDKNSPITLSSIIYNSFYKRLPKFVSRLLGCFFIMCFPILIYFELYIYYTRMKDTTLELINHGVARSYLTMLCWFEECRELNIPFLFNPWVLIIVFYVIGIIFVVRQESIGKLIEDALLNPVWVNKNVLCLRYDSLELFSHIKIEEECVYGRLKSVMVARFFCILNPTFWCHVRRVSFGTGKGCLKHLRTEIPMPFYYFLVLMIWPFRLLRCALELSVCFIYYGLPFLFLMVLTIVGFMKPFSRWLIDISGTLREKAGDLFTNFVITAFVILASILCCYYSLTIILIFNASFTFILRGLFFVFVAVLVYPSTAFVYVSFGIALAYYLYMQLSGIDHTYFDLLLDTVKSLQALEKESNELKVVTSYKNRVAGIPQKLYLHVVQKHRPIFISVFKAMLPIVLVIILMPGTIQITSCIPNNSSTVTEVMKVIFIVLIGALPRAVEIAFSDSNKPVLKEIFLKKLETTILEYNKSLIERRSSNAPVVEID